MPKPLPQRLSGKESICNVGSIQETWAGSLGWEDPLEEEMVTCPRILAWRSHGQRSLAGYSPWGRKELDTTQREHQSLSEFMPYL